MSVRGRAGMVVPLAKVAFSQSVSQSAHKPTSAPLSVLINKQPVGGIPMASEACE